MNPFNPLRRTALRAGALAAALIAAPLAHAEALPAESLYRLSVPLKDSQGRQFDWRALAGRPLLVTMFYGDCNAACPIIIENLRRTVDEVKPAPGRLAVLMVSLDPLYDSPASLADLAKSHKLDPAIFRLAVAANETHTRAMAGALQVKYRSVSNGEINHTTRVSLLDANGKVLASSTQLSPLPDPALVAQIKLAVK
ncbi:SCO family protein [Massilia atriviolacea]|uniref:SCO family protein n=1 Tax=Massilia atriviolacea TaxID=2495579 RepID=A0A430HT45_9BURK|nr:SCO family protein [Massilia atriviolacea]RSZ60690.1 SCO family protein [Massilia atriviolacea]